jgi:hypothetical protein
MNRVSILVALVALSGVRAADASTIIPITDTDDGTTVGTLAVTRTNGVSAGWDEIDLHFASWTVTQFAFDTFVEMVYGSWAGVGGNLGVSSLGGSDWAPKTTNANSSTLLESFVNLDSMATSTAGQPDFSRGDGSAGAYASFQGSWLTKRLPEPWFNQGGCLGPTDWSMPYSPSDDHVDETLLAKIYLTSAADVTFNGWFAATGDGRDEPASELVYVPVRISTVVPEPSASVLLGVGLAGALVWGWRKRRPAIKRDFCVIVGQ